MIPTNGLNTPILAIVGNNEVTKTYKVDTVNKRIEGTVNGEEAMRQAILKNLDTERYSYVIYSPNYAIEFVKYIGKDFDYIKADLTRALEECLLVDNRVIAISNVEIEQIGLDSMSINFDVQTTEGVLNITKEVTI